MTQQQRQSRLTADAFLEWAMEQPSGRFELLRGKIVARRLSALGTRA